MTEAVQSQTAEATPRRSPLGDVHARAGAELREQDGCVVAAHYGDAVAEYEAVRGGAGAGLFDLSSRGRVEVSGGEAVQFLNGMLTNDVAKLEDGAWMSAAFPNPQGRLVATVRVLRRGGSFLFDTEAATYGRVLKHLERYTLAGDFRVRDLTVETALLTVQGARAQEIVSAALDETLNVERGRVSTLRLKEAEVTLLRATHTAEDGVDLLVNAAEAESLWNALTEAGARRAGFDALEVLRVEAGLPRYGVDSSEANVVLEVVDEAEAVSYTKGCYAGQEIIARIHWRGHVAKKLAGVIFASDAEPPADATVRSCAEGREVGRITSNVFSPRLRRRVALAVIRHDSLAPGTELKVFSGEEELCAAHVAELPLVRGSWYASASGESE
jgi:folate-binding protein YgfZ